MARKPVAKVTIGVLAIFPSLACDEDADEPARVKSLGEDREG